MTLKLTQEQAAELRATLLRVTKDDSFEFPSARVVLLREVIAALDTDEV